MIEFGGNLSLIGATAKGYANGGLKGALRAGGSAVVMDLLSRGAANRLFKGAAESGKVAQGTLIGKMLDKVQEAFLGEEAACLPRGGR